MTAHAHRRRIRATGESEPELDDLYARFHDFVRRALRRHYVEPGELDDMTQEVFVVLLRRVDEATETRSLGSWLYQIARRVAANHHRWQRRRVRKHTELGSDPTPVVVARETVSPEQAYAREQAWAFIREFIESLDEEACAVFVMSEIEGLRGAEIAARLRLTLPMTYARIRTVRARFDRAVSRSQRSVFAGLWLALRHPTVSLGTHALASSWRISAVVGVALLALLWMFGSRHGPTGEGDGADPSGPVVDGARPAEAGTRSSSTLDPNATPAIRAAVFDGIVVDLEGAPIVGAVVCADRSEDADHRLDDPPVCVTTGHDGRFVVRGVLAQAHTLEAMARGFVPGRFRGRATRGIRIVLHPGGVELAGVVSDVHGGPVEGAWVAAENRIDTTLGAAVRTDEHGAFSLWVVQGQVSLAAGADGYATTFNGALAPSRDVRIELGAESVIAGVVVDGEGGRPVEGVRVSALLVPEAERYANRGRVGFSDAAGRWEIRGLQPNQYVLDAASHDGWGRGVQAIDLGIGERVDGVRIEMLAGVSVVGRVFDEATGVGCADGFAATIDRAQSIDRGAPVGDDGLVTVAPLAGGALYDVRVSCRGYASAVFEVDLRDGPVAEQAWPLARGGELRVRVVDDVGAPLPDWRVEIAEIGTETTADDGSAVFTGIEPGSYRVSARGPGHPPVVVEGARVEGERSEVELRTPPGVAVRGTVVSTAGSAIPGALVSLQRATGNPTADSDDPGPYRATTDAHGDFELASVAAGEYGVWVLPADAAVAALRPEARPLGGKPLRTVNVRATEVRLDLRLGGLRSISGVVRDEDGDVIADARVFAVRERDGEGPDPRGRREGSDPRGRPHLSDTDGRYRFDDLPGGTYALAAYRPGGGVVRLVGVDAGTSDADLVFRETGSISGTVRSADGSPVQGYLLVINRIGVARSEIPSIPAGSKDGRFLVPGLDGGQYALLAFAPEGRGDLVVDLTDGDDRAGVDITLEPSSHLEGRLVDPSGAPLVGWVAAARPPGATADPPPEWMLIDTTRHDGTFAIHDLPPGPVALVAFPGTDALFDAPPGAVDTLVVSSPELRVFTPDPGDLLDAGDVIVDPGA